MRAATRLSPRVPFAVPAPDRCPSPRDTAAPASLGPRLSSPIGAIGDLFGGLLGIGGGSAIAPLLLLAGSLRPAQIAGTTLAAVLLIVIYSSTVLFSPRGQPSEDDISGGGPNWSPAIGLAVLATVTGGMVVISDMLVGSIEGFIEETGISEVFLGLILIPIFSNVVVHIVAITVSLKNRMDMSLTISVGSAAQVACLVIPIIVLVSTFVGQPAGMIFASVELIALAIGLLMIVPVLLDGRGNWLEGAQLLTVYTILGTVLWVI